MKAIIIEDFGGSEKLKLADIPTPIPADNEVLISIECTSVNPVDWKIREGHLAKRLPYHFPIIPGWDAAGKIKALGKDVKNFKVGDEVYAYCKKPTIQWGTYAEYVTVEAQYAALKPKKLSFAQAAAIPLTGLTALQALSDVAHLKNEETILIHAGSGGVGGLAIQFAKCSNTFVITTTSKSHQDYVKKLGADLVIDYTTEDFVKKTKEKFPQGIDVVFDTVGGETYRKSFEVLKSGGRIVSLLEQPDEERAKKMNVKAYYLFVKPNGDELRMIADLIDEGRVVAPKIDQMPLEKAKEAQEKSQKGHMEGKIVLTVKH